MSDEERGERSLTPVVLLVGALLAGSVYWGVVESRRAIPDGTAAPAFELERHEGGTIRLEDLRGKVVLLDFWATWCPPCVAEMPALVRLAREYEDRGVVLVAANRDDPSQARRLVAQFSAARVPGLGRFVALATDEVSAAYKVEVLPTLYILDRQGRIADAHTGAASEAQLRVWVDRVLAAER